MVNYNDEDRQLDMETEAAEARPEAEDHGADIDARERDIARRELKLWAIDALKEKGLPAKLAEILDYTDQAACGASLDLVEDVVRQAIQEGVDERLARSRGGLNRGASGEAALMARVRGVMGLKD